MVNHLVNLEHRHWHTFQRLCFIQNHKIKFELSIHGVWNYEQWAKAKLFWMGVNYRRHFIKRCIRFSATGACILLVTRQVSSSKSAMQSGVFQVAASRKFFRWTDLRMPKLQIAFANCKKSSHQTGAWHCNVTILIFKFGHKLLKGTTDVFLCVLIDALWRSISQKLLNKCHSSYKLDWIM